MAEWVDVQKSTFTRWANTFLSRKRMEIDDLYEDLRDGIRLIALLQIICREKVCRKFNKNPRMRIQKMENLNFAFAFMQKKNVMVTNIGSSDILDGNNKLVLGLMWTLIKHFQVSAVEMEGVSGKDGLLLWVNRSLAEYKNLEVKNFSGSWSSGLAFCALIHRFYPNLIDYPSLSASNPDENVRLAFQTAQDVFGIPQLLNVNDVAGKIKPDEKSIMTYVSLLFKEFASGVQKQKAITTISKAINIAQRHHDMANEYAKTAKGLLEWLEIQVQKFQTMTLPKSLDDIRRALTAHDEYKNNEKPPREAAFVSVEGCASRWMSSCKTNNRPMPVLEPPIEKIQEMKNQLDKLEADIESRLRHQLENFQKTFAFLNKVGKELEKIEAWAKDKKENSVIFQGTENVSSSSEAEEKMESLLFLEEVELPRYQALIANVVNSASELDQDSETAAQTMERVNFMNKFVEDVAAQLGQAKQQLQDELQAQLKVDAVVKDVKVLVRNLKYSIEEMDEEIESMTNLQEWTKDGLISAQKTFESSVLPKLDELIVKENEKLNEKKEVLALAKRANDVALIEKTQQRVTKLLESCEEKKKFFAEEIDNVEKRNEKCKEFGALALKMKEQCAANTQLMTESFDDITDHLDKMNQLKKTLFASDEDSNDSLACLMAQLEQMNEELEKLRVFSNPFSSESIHGLRAMYSSLENALKDKIKSLEKELALSQVGNLTAQQLTEIREVFNHFDLDGDGIFEREEFIMACKGLGFALSEDECHDWFDKLDEKNVDELTFSQFSKFCAEQMQSGSSKEDIENAFGVLTKDNLTLEKIEEQFEKNVTEFVKNHKDELVGEDDVIDLAKFEALVFSV